MDYQQQLAGLRARHAKQFVATMQAISELRYGHVGNCYHWAQNHSNIEWALHNGLLGYVEHEWYIQKNDLMNSPTEAAALEQHRIKKE